jgi:hypothetical protein
LNANLTSQSTAVGGTIKVKRISPDGPKIKLNKDCLKVFRFKSNSPDLNDGKESNQQAQL